MKRVHDQLPDGPLAAICRRELTLLYAALYKEVVTLV
jgi:hypothetical protein